MRAQAFWSSGLRGAYHDPAKLTEEMMLCYRWPAQVKGADRGVANFVLAQFAAVGYEMRARIMRRRRGRSSSSSPPSAAIATTTTTSLVSDDEQALLQAPPAAAILSDAEVVAALKTARVPILIVHGVHDRIVPISNSRRLVERLGGAANGVSLLEVEDAGHCPQEETYDVVSEAVSEFVGLCCA